MTKGAKIALGLSLTAALGVGGFFGYRFWRKNSIPKVTVEGIDYIDKVILMKVNGETKRLGFGNGFEEGLMTGDWEIKTLKESDGKVVGVKVIDTNGVIVKTAYSQS